MMNAEDRWRSEADMQTAERYGGDDLRGFAEALHAAAVEACGDAAGTVTPLRYNSHGLNFTAVVAEGDTRRVIITNL